MEEKLEMVRESFEPGETVSMVTRQHGVNSNQVFHWRTFYQDGSLSAVSAGEEVEPAAESAETLKHVRELQRILSVKTGAMPWNAVGRKIVDCTLTIVAGGRPVKQVCEVLCVARSIAAAERARPADWYERRTARPTDDAGLVDEIRHVIADLPS